MAILAAHDSSKSRMVMRSSPVSLRCDCPWRHASASELPVAVLLQWRCCVRVVPACAAAVHMAHARLALSIRVRTVSE